MGYYFILLIACFNFSFLAFADGLTQSTAVVQVGVVKSFRLKALQKNIVISDLSLDLSAGNDSSSNGVKTTFEIKSSFGHAPLEVWMSLNGESGLFASARRVLARDGDNVLPLLIKFHATSNGKQVPHRGGSRSRKGRRESTKYHIEIIHDKSRSNSRESGLKSPPGRYVLNLIANISQSD